MLGKICQDSEVKLPNFGCKKLTRLQTQIKDVISISGKTYESNPVFKKISSAGCFDTPSCEIAALNIEGTTIHSFFRFPPRLVIDEDIKKIHDRKLIRKIDLLIIDEISMVRSEIIDAIDKFLRLNRDNEEFFGGVQLLLVGDLFQLPPVLNRKEWKALQMKGYESSYFFSAKVLNKCAMVSKELTKIFRQSDEYFINLLNQIRIAENIENSALKQINLRVIPPGNMENSIITLVSTNNTADFINNRELEKLKSPVKTFIGEVSGKFALKEEKLPSPINLALKIGAQVMFTKNDERKRWVNGTIGRVVDFEDNYIRVEISVNNLPQTYDVLHAKWESFKYEYDDEKDRIIPVSTGYYVQYPLMLAWAITIHKSQGKTLDKVRIDLGHGAFEYGQVYVALSRCRSLNDIYLSKPIRLQDIKCDPIIKRFYKALDAS